MTYLSQKAFEDLEQINAFDYKRKSDGRILTIPTQKDKQVSAGSVLRNGRQVFLGIHEKKTKKGTLHYVCSTSTEGGRSCEMISPKKKVNLEREISEAEN